MKKTTNILLTLLLLGLSACAESKKTDNSPALAALTIANLNSCGTTAKTVTSIGATSRTEYDFTNCNNPTALTGFSVQNISAGLTGTSDQSKLASTGTFGSVDKKINIEVTYTLTSSTSILDVIALGGGTGTSLSGPGFRISPTDVKYLTTAGTASAFGTGTSPSSAVGTNSTLCLEVHQEGSGSHIFGWSGACSAVANLGSYTFDQENVTGTISDSKIGFVLNNVKLSKIIVSNGKLGTSGSLQSF